MKKGGRGNGEGVWSERLGARKGGKGRPFGEKPRLEEVLQGGGGQGRGGLD